MKDGREKNERTFFAMLSSLNTARNAPSYGEISKPENFKIVAPLFRDLAKGVTDAASRIPNRQYAVCSGVPGLILKATKVYPSEL